MRNLQRLVLFYAVAGLLAIFAATTGNALPIPKDAAFVFPNGTDGYQCFRIPAIVQTSDGTLMAFAEGRRNSCNDFGDIQIVMKTSRNRGKTWSSLQVVAAYGTLQAGNPAPVVDTLDARYPKGRVFLIYNTGDASESAVREGHGSRRIWYRTSVDDGATWAEPVEITTSVKLPSWRSYATGPGHALQLTSGTYAGRILVAANHSEGTAQSASQTEAHTFFSDDHGHTWRLGATLAWRGSNESTATQAEDGSVVMNSRDQSGASHARILAISKSGGEHWDESFIAHDLPDPVCQGSMIRYAPKKGRSVLLFSNAGSITDRSHLTISASKDGGLTWPRHTLIYAGPSAYSDIVVMGRGTLGILWEHGSDGGIVFQTRKIGSLM
jgi:sialidase-1